MDDPVDPVAYQQVTSHEVGYLVSGAHDISPNVYTSDGLSISQQSTIHWLSFSRTA